MKDPNVFTGVLLTENDPLETLKYNQTRNYANYIIKNILPLKAPSTADFQRVSDGQGKKLDKNTWEYSSYVDAQNSFGAMIRTDWTMKVRYTGVQEESQVDYSSHIGNFEIVGLVVDGKRVK